MKLESGGIYNIVLESVIQHHQEAVSSVQWALTEGNAFSSLVLMSSSFDFTVALWRPDPSGAWSVESTLGALVGNKHAYFGAIFLGNANHILANTYGGAMHQWSREDSENSWKTQLTIKGHFGPVCDLDWDQHNLSLITASND